MYPQWLENKLIQEAEQKRSSEIREFIRNAPSEEEPPKEYRFEYNLGDTVYIGADEYTILSLEDPVILNDSQYPLFNKEFPKAEFEEKVKENPANNHLRVEVEVERPITVPETDIVVDDSLKPDFILQYEQVKRENPDSVVILHTGSFYYTFGKDAEILGEHTGYTVEKKNLYGNVFTPHLAVLDFNKSYCVKALNDNNVNAVIFEMNKGVIERYPEKTERENRQENFLYFVEPENKEQEVLYKVLWSLRLEDIVLNHEGDTLVATDYDNTWRGDEFYKFLVEEVFVFKDDGSVAAVDAELLKEFTELSEKHGVPVKDNRYTPLYRDYLEVKNENPDNIVLYQVGDFYEVFNKDAEVVAEALELVLTSRNIGGDKRVPMAGFPNHRLETFTDMLTDRGFDIAISSLENGERKTVTLVSMNKEDPVESKPVGRIDYLHTNGAVRESIEYTSEYQFVKDIKEENQYGVPMSIVVYADKDGNTIPIEFATELDPPLQGFDIVPSPYLELAEVEKSEELTDAELIGKEVFIDGDKYIIEKIDPVFGDVSMRDATAVYPINRVEKIGFVREHLREEETPQKFTTEKVAEYPAVENRLPYDVVIQTIKTSEPELTPPVWEDKKEEKVTTLKPTVPESEKHNYRITDDNLGVGGAKEKFRNNMAAINLLKELEFEDRLATPEEQEILAKYVGFGGLADAFDESKENWADEYKELIVTLTPEEYAAARESTLTAFYTPPVVIRAMYEALGNMGFENGNILEPSCGTGNFIGMLPEKMNDSKFYGVELDSLTGRIAQQLYQKSGITVQGYEKASLPDNFFDVAIGNVPFGQFKIIDKKYDKNNWLIHDYFFGKTLDKVRPGGIVAFITSSGTMDKKNPAVRKYIAQRAELLGAIRLPNNTFKANAGTEVTSDILFLQKRDTLTVEEPDWVHLDRDENGNEYNKYFVDNPEMVLGEMVMESSQFGQSLTCKPYDDRPLADQLSEAVQNIHAEITEFEVEEMGETDDHSIPADPDVKNFSFTLVDGKIYYRQDSRMNPVDVSATAENRIKGMIEIRDQVRELIRLQTEDYPESAIISAQEELNEVYDKFTKKYGLLNARANRLVFSDDSAYCLLCSLEVIGENGELERKADMFSKRTIKPHIKVTSVSTSSEALAVSIGEKARVDMDYMCELTGKTEQEIFEDLKGVIFLNPEYTHDNGYDERYLPADEYLSGNVRKKLELAKRTAELYPEDYNINVEMLEKVQPVDLTASEISVRLGATWLPPEDVQQFMFELFQTPRYAQWNINVRYAQQTAEWYIENKNYDRSNIMANSTYGTNRINGYKIIEETLNLKDVRIFDYVEDEHGNKKPVLNKKETAIAQGKQEMIKQAFQDWIW
ncbi:MAG: hypothetical protein UH249_08985, partial [Acutalibacteraceae bacterium]|nr:hypothetical protein [Acutalibacteraceae bacterium]